jgi:hypothetical protein
VQFVIPNYTAGERDGSATISVFLSASSTQPVTVSYATSDGTAKTPKNYMPANGTLTFAPGETVKYFDVGIVDDLVVNADQTVNLTLSAPQNATLGSQSTATLTITEADTPPTVQFDYAAFEVSEVGVNAEITLYLSAPSPLPITVNYATSDGTATKMKNYMPAMGTLTFAPGATTQRFQVGIVDDFVVNPNQTVSLALSSPNNATLGLKQAKTPAVFGGRAVVGKGRASPGRPFGRRLCRPDVEHPVLSFCFRAEGRGGSEHPDSDFGSSGVNNAGHPPDGRRGIGAGCRPTRGIGCAALGG